MLSFKYKFVGNDNVSEISNTSSLQYGSESMLDPEVQSSLIQPLFREEFTTSIMEWEWLDPNTLSDVQPFVDSPVQDMDEGVSNWKDTPKSLSQSQEDWENNNQLPVPQTYHNPKNRKDVNTFKVRKKRVYIDSSVKSFVMKMKVLLENEYPHYTLKKIALLLNEKVRERFPYELILNNNHSKKNNEFDMRGLVYNLNRKPKLQ